MSKKIGFAVAGTGNIGRHHIECIKESRGAELVAIWGRTPETVKGLAKTNGVYAYTDFDEMLERDDIHVVNICTPSGMHSDMIIRCAAAGKHVISEKPLDITLEKIDSAIFACKEVGVKLACVFQNRFIGTNRMIKKSLNKGAIGKPLIGTASILWYRPQEYYDKGGWRGTWALDGGGALMNQSIHTIDLLQWFMGPAESVMGYTDALNHDIETEDSGVAVIRFKNGALGTILGTTCAYPGLATTIQLIGEKGSIISDNNKLKAWKMQRPNHCEAAEEEVKMLKSYGAVAAESGSADPTAITKEGHIFQIEDMVCAIIEGREPILTGEDARHSVEIILAIYESSRLGREVRLYPQG